MLNSGLATDRSCWQVMANQISSDALPVSISDTFTPQLSASNSFRNYDAPVMYYFGSLDLVAALKGLASLVNNNNFHSRSLAICLSITDI